MKLYHGTSSLYLDKILKRGLEPRGKRKGNWKHTVDSCPDAVYLTTAYAVYFAVTALKNMEKAVIFEVDSNKLNPFLLAPDEDALAHTTKEGDLMENSRMFREKLHEYAGTDQWELSLKVMGNCAHLGPVMPDAFLRMAIIDMKQAKTLRWMGLDPCISPINYRICGAKYRNLCKWVFGDELEQDELFGGFDIARLPPDEERAAIEVVGLRQPALHR